MMISKKYFCVLILLGLCMFLASCTTNERVMHEPIYIDNLSGEYIAMCSSVWGAFSKTKTKEEIEKEFPYKKTEYFYEDGYLIAVTEIESNPALLYCIVYVQRDGIYHFYEGALIDGIHEIDHYRKINVGDTLESVLEYDKATQIWEIDGHFYSYHHCKNSKTLVISYKKQANNSYVISSIDIFNEDFCFVDSIAASTGS